jgi:hypothetical protein
MGDDLPSGCQPHDYEAALALGGSVPFGLNTRQMESWLVHGGGNDLLQEVLAGFNCHGIPMGSGFKAQRESAVTSLAQANAQRDQAQLNLSYTTVTAAQPGRVVQLSAMGCRYPRILMLRD